MIAEKKNNYCQEGQKYISQNNGASKIELWPFAPSASED